MIKEFLHTLGIEKLLKDTFKTNDPVLSAILGKEALASQPTLSRFFNRMDDDRTFAVCYSLSNSYAFT